MKEIIVGVNKEKFMVNPNIKYQTGLLYYGPEGKLTNTYYIKYPVTLYKGNFKNTLFPVMVIEHVKRGDLLATCTIYGCAMKCDNENVAFARVCSRESIKNSYSSRDYVEVCYAEIL